MITEHQLGVWLVQGAIVLWLISKAIRYARRTLEARRKVVQALGSSPARRRRAADLDLKSVAVGWLLRR